MGFYAGITRIVALLLATFLLPKVQGVVWTGEASGHLRYSRAFKSGIQAWWQKRPEARRGCSLVIHGLDDHDPSLGIYRTQDGGWVLSGALSGQEIREGLIYLARGGVDLFWNRCAACRDEGDPWQARDLWWDATIRSRLAGSGTKEDWGDETNGKPA